VHAYHLVARLQQQSSGEGAINPTAHRDHHPVVLVIRHYLLVYHRLEWGFDKDFMQYYSQPLRLKKRNSTKTITATTNITPG